MVTVRFEPEMEPQREVVIREHQPMGRATGVELALMTRGRGTGIRLTYDEARRLAHAVLDIVDGPEGVR